MSTTANQILGERRAASSPESQSESERSRNHEGGYTVVMTSLLLIPLLIFAAFATDVGSWYIKADQAQHGADAAALAGAVWMPDIDKATAVALDVAARNGFRDQRRPNSDGLASNATVSVVEEAGDLRVDIETKAPSYLGSVVLDNVSLHRRAKAAALKPVRMGNPSNAIGTGNLSVDELGLGADGVWLAINAYCMDHETGDPFNVGFYGSRFTSRKAKRSSCPNSNLGANPTYNPDGYTFVVDVPPGAGQVDLQVFEPGVCRDSNQGDQLFSANDKFDGPGSNAPRLNLRVFRNDGTQDQHEDNLGRAPVFEHLYRSNDCTGGDGAGGRWYPIYSIPGGAANEGRWYIQADSRATDTVGYSNNFSLRAQPAGRQQLCTSATLSTCPRIYALDWLSVYRPDFGGSAFAGVPSEFFLAEIDSGHAGDTMQVKLFDPGEGMNHIEFINPDGESVDFEFRLANCTVGLLCNSPTRWPETELTGNDRCGGEACLRVSNSRFQDQWIVVETKVPGDYRCGNDCWWRVRYTPETGRPVIDRSTWSVQMLGGPVYLTG